MSKNRPSQMDVYANAFIPQWLRDIQDTPAQLVFSTVANEFEIAFEDYTRTFAGSSLLPIKDLSPKSPPFFTSTSNHVLKPRSYGLLFRQALSNEFLALQTSQTVFTLYKIRMNSTVPDAAGAFLTATLMVPGLRENSPFIRLGDTVILRPLFLDEFGHPLSFQQLPGQTAFFFPVRGWTGCEFQSIVTSINRHQETISVKIDNLEAFVSYGINYYSVSFPIRATWATSQYISVQDASNMLKKTDIPEKWMKQMLFPEPSDGALQQNLNPAEFKSNKIFNTQLNFEQLKAVSAVVKDNYGAIPYLISGPPGTGKTMTTVECALQLILHGRGSKQKHILICAPSDPAADTLAQRLKQHLELSDLFRLNSPSRTFAEVPESLMAYCYVENRCFGLPPIDRFIRYRIVVTTCRDADILIRARLTNRDLHDHGMRYITLLHPDMELKNLALHWDAVFIDEAAQATEPEALIPLTVAAPPPSYTGTKIPQVVMAGDHKQLGPRTASKIGLITTSLFERLLERPAYSQHPLARHHIIRKGAAQTLTRAMLPIIRPPFCDLIRNYRSHPAILAIPNSLFYHDTLHAEAANTESLLAWSGWKGRGWPVLFTCNNGNDELEKEGGGWYNVLEAKKACAHALSFMNSGLIRQEDICVMSPFQAQVRCLRMLFRDAGIGQVNIGPIEAFQGLESRLVIICTTRSRPRFMEQDAARGLGIMNEPKRFNVALTRAMQGLIVIGNPELLSKDPIWLAFLDFCRRNQLWERKDLYTAEEDSPFWHAREMKKKRPVKVPTMERLLLNYGQNETEEKQLGSIMTYDDEMWARGLHDALPTKEDNDDDEEEEEEISTSNKELIDEDENENDEDEDDEENVVGGFEVRKNVVIVGTGKKSWTNEIVPFLPQAHTK